MTDSDAPAPKGQPPKDEAAKGEPANGGPAKKPRPRKVAAPARAGAAPAKPRSTPRKRKPATPPPPSGLRPLWVASAVAAGIVALDQLIKWIVVHALNLKEVLDIQVLDPWLNLRMAWNQGVNFGLFSSDENIMRWVLVAIAVAVCCWVAVWLWRAAPGRLGQISAGLLIGGAVGNVIDRLAYGAVADFLNMSLPGWRNPYSFNVADIAIFVGAMGLVFQPGPQPNGDKPRDGARKTR